MEIENKTFKPITLTINTEEEAIVIWNRLNTASPRVEFSIKEKKHDHACLDADLSLELWQRFNELFPLRKIEKGKEDEKYKT